MRLFRFEARNFKGIEHISVDWEDLIVLIGENNAGKSSLLSAIAAFLSGSSIKDPALFRRHRTDADNAIELIGHFDQLTATELEQVAVRGRTGDGKWVLKKRYWLEPGADGEAGGWKEQLYSFSSEEQFKDWPDNEAAWGNFPADYADLIAALPAKPPKPNAGARETLKAIIRAQRPELVVNGAPTWLANPGGGGNWKSNANSILPRAIFVRAVHEATDETNAKDASTYGKLINLIVERSLAQRPEMAALQVALDKVLSLFRPDPEHPERQADEVRELQSQINRSLSDVVGGEAYIRTGQLELRSLVMPSTSLVIRDPLANVETDVAHQGHGLQRTLVMTLLQLLVEAQGRDAAQVAAAAPRSSLLLVEEPELFLHPQMERLMRDVLTRLAEQPGMQVACCTHSPVFLDIANRYRSIVRVFKTDGGDAKCHQVTGDLFPGAEHQAEKQRLQTVARFDPTVNELFFARSVVLMEEFSAIAAFERAADLMGLFQRHKRLRREVTLVDCNGKWNIPAFQRVLSAFSMPYRVLHDADPGKPEAQEPNRQIAQNAQADAQALVYAVDPELEGLLGYLPPKKNKPYAAVCRVEELFADGGLPPAFQEAVCMAFFGQSQEPLPI